MMHCVVIRCVLLTSICAALHILFQRSRPLFLSWFDYVHRTSLKMTRSFSGIAKVSKELQDPSRA